MSKGENLGIGSTSPLVDSPDLPVTPSVKAQSTVNGAVEQIAGQTRLPDSAISGQAEKILRFLVISRPNMFEFPDLFNLCQVLLKKCNVKNNVVTANDPENAVTQLYIAQKPDELPKATPLFAQMRKVLDWEALQNPDNRLAVRKVIQRLNEKMGCASQFIQANLDRAFLETNQASRELFCDLMTHQDNGLQNDTTRNRTASLLFNACPPKNLEKLLKVFQQEAIKLTHSEAQQSKFKHMSTCLELAIQVRNSINEISDKKLKIENLTEVQKDNPDIVMAIIKRSVAVDFEYVSDELKKNFTIALAAVKKNGFLLTYVDPTIKNYSEVALAAVQDYAGAFEYVDATAKNYGQFALVAVKIKGNLLKFVDPTKVKNYGEIALAAVQENPWVFKYVDSTAENYGQIALEVVKKDGDLLKHVDPKVENYDEIALAAVKNNAFSFKRVPRTIKNYNEVACAAVQKNVSVFSLVDSTAENYSEILFAAVKENGPLLKLIDPTLENYAEIALETVKKDGLTLQYVARTVKNYDEVALAAVQQYAWTFEKVDPTVKNYGEIALVAVKKDGFLIRQLASTAFKNDLPIILAALKQDNDAIKYVAPEMQHHPEVLKVL